MTDYVIERHHDVVDRDSSGTNNAILAVVVAVLLVLAVWLLARGNFGYKTSSYSSNPSTQQQGIQVRGEATTSPSTNQ